MMRWTLECCRPLKGIMSKFNFHLFTKKEPVLQHGYTLCEHDLSRVTINCLVGAVAEDLSVDLVRALFFQTSDSFEVLGLQQRNVLLKRRRPVAENLPINELNMGVFVAIVASDALNKKAF